MTQESYWDALPEELQELILAHKKLIEFAAVIQKHYRKVRFTPGEAPRFCSAKGQRAIVQWHSTKEFPGDGGWVSADVLKFHKNSYPIDHGSEPPGREIWKDLATARLRWKYSRKWILSNGETRTDTYSKKIMWFDPKKRPEWAGDDYDYIYPSYYNNIAPARVALIKPW